MPAGAGLVLILIGRGIYGDWLERSPVANASSTAIRILGFLVTAIFGSMLLFLLATGITADDLTATAALGIGTTLGLALVFLGFRIKPGSGRSYLD
jgi:quinol-cytochrome oxidoreductase complex cytochrome b subunit